MKPKRDTPKVITGRKAFERLLRGMLRDQSEHRRLLAALDRDAEQSGARSPYAPLRQRAIRLGHELDLRIAEVGRAVEEAGADSLVDPRLKSDLSSERRWRREVLQKLPSRLFEGVPLESIEADRARVRRFDARPVAGLRALDRALSDLPVAWLKQMAALHAVRGPTSRARLAAGIADRLQDPEYLLHLVSAHLDDRQKRLLARLVAGGLLDQARVKDDTFEVPLAWDGPPTGSGDWLRRLGLVFVGRHVRVADGEPYSAVYVPENLRPVLARVLEDLDLTEGAPESEKHGIRILADAERERRSAESKARERGWMATYGLPTNHARVRRPTPGPDRVYDIEVLLGLDHFEPVLGEDGRQVMRRVRISYQRTLRALHEAIDLAFGHTHSKSDRFFTISDPGEVQRRGRPEPEWTTSIRDAFHPSAPRLRYMGGLRLGCPEGVHFLHELRVVAIHAPELVEDEMRVVWGEGTYLPMPLDGTGTLQAMIDAANVFLSRVDD